MTIKDLFGKFNKWLKSIVKDRVDNTAARNWVYDDIEYDKELKLTDYQAFFDRRGLNNEYKKRYKNDDIPSKKPHAWYQSEINAIYSFHKCFAMRNFTRLQYYRNDLSQKSKRNLTTINQTLAKFEHLKDVTEKKSR